MSVAEAYEDSRYAQLHARINEAVEAKKASFLARGFGASVEAGYHETDTLRALLSCVAYHAPDALEAALDDVARHAP